MENIKEDKNMVMVYKPKEIMFTKGTFSMMSNWVKVKIYSKTEIIMKENSKTTMPMVKEFILGKMEKDMKDFLKMERDTATADTFIRTETFSKAFIHMI